MKTISDLKIRTKLLSAFLMVLGLMAFVGVFGIEKMTSMNAISQDIDKNWLPSIQVLADIRAAVIRVQAVEYRAVLEGADDPALASAWTKDLAESDAKIDKMLADYELLIVNATDRTYLDAERNAWLAYSATIEPVLDLVSASKVRGGRAGRFARVRVSDDGPGIPLDLQERVFDPLYTTKPTGTGLGLAVVSRIVSQHHGFLSVDSAPGAGTCFSMYLPAT